MTPLLFLAAMAVEPIPLDVPPSEVTVFADQARVRRSGRASLPRGEQSVAFVGLPPHVIDDSITADISGAAELLGIQVRRISATEVADARVAEIEAELEALRDAKQDREDDAQAAQARLQAAERARTASARQLSAQMLVATDAPGTARALRTALAAEDEAAREAVRRATVALREVNDRIAALERERRDLGSSATDTLTAVVTLDVAAAGAVTVDLDYGMYGASWRPRYDLRGDAASGDVELGLSAIVTQTTGEDWSDVRLAVSSARPGRGTDVPELHPFWLQPYVPYRPARTARAPAAAGAAMMDMEADTAVPAPPPPPMEVATAQVDIQLAATTFRVAGREDIPSDGTERKVLLTTVDLESALRHVAVPRLDPATYLVGEVTNSADFPLLPGEAGVFVGGAYVGDIWLDTVPSGDTFDVSFGPDDRVTVRRTRRETSTGDSGPVGRRRSASWRWDVSARSAHAAPVTVEIREQVPLSPRDDIEVVTTVDRGGPTPVEEDGGILAFDLEVPARGESSFTWGYTVTYPGDLTLGWME